MPIPFALSRREGVRKWDNEKMPLMVSLGFHKRHYFF